MQVKYWVYIFSLCSQFSQYVLILPLEWRFKFQITSWKFDIIWKNADEEIASNSKDYFKFRVLIFVVNKKDVTYFIYTSKICNFPRPFGRRPSVFGSATGLQPRIGGQTHIELSAHNANITNSLLGEGHLRSDRWTNTRILGIDFFKFGAYIDTNSQGIWFHIVLIVSQQCWSCNCRLEVT